MERLTIKPGICAMASTDFCESMEDCYMCSHHISIVRGLELAQAEKEGLIIVLPEKWVYEVQTVPGPGCNHIHPVEIDGQPICSLCDHGVEKIAKVECQQEHLDKIGKTIFLTYEECDEYQKEGGNPRAETD